MTFSIVARCPKGRFGVAVASESMAIGLYCHDAVRASVGTTFTQGVPHPRNNGLAQGLLTHGHTVQHTLRELAANDDAFESRQIALIDRDGAAAAHTGVKLRPWSGHRVGAEYVVLGESAAGEHVLQAIASAFEAHADAELELRLLVALEAGRDAGGLVGPEGTVAERSVALVVQGHHPYTDTDLRVDLHEGAIAELRRLYEEYQPYAAYYDERGKKPRNAIPQREFADMLNSKKGARA